MRCNLSTPLFVTISVIHIRFHNYVQDNKLMKCPLLRPSILLIRTMLCLVIVMTLMKYFQLLIVTCFPIHFILFYFYHCMHFLLVSFKILCLSLLGNRFKIEEHSALLQLDFRVRRNWFLFPCRFYSVFFFLHNDFVCRSQIKSL